MAAAVKCFSTLFVVAMYFVVLISILVVEIRADTNKDNLSCEKLYFQGVEAYLEERWDDCIGFFEKAMKEYNTFRQMTIDCRSRCQYEAEAAPHMAPYDTENLHFYETLIKKTLCILKCKKNVFKERSSSIAAGADKAFSIYKPYDYLHLCYYQKNLLQKAASAAFTFLVANPKNEVMIENLKFYSNLPEVDMTKIENFESKPYVSLYIHGSDAYNKGDYKSVINYFENSLEDYLKEDEDCRAYCEGPFDQGWFPDYTLSVANHFTFCLKCKYNCSATLNSLNGEAHDDLLPSHYHFLQYAYYKVGMLKKACEAVESYLLFYPADETMIKNKKFYLSQSEVKKTYFVPREEAVRYVQRQQYESKLLQFIETEFKSEQKKNPVDTNDIIKAPPQSHTMDVEDAELSKKKLSPPPIVKFQWPQYKAKDSALFKVKENISNEEPAKKENSLIRQIKIIEDDEIKKLKERAVKQIKRTIKKDVKLVMGEKELHGTDRFLADGFAQEYECRKLMEIAQIAAVQGDGYTGNKSPHSEHEKFEGLTLGRAALLVYFGLMDPDDLELYLNISERGRDYVERHFNLKKKLQFNFTHLVCRTALLSSSTNRSDMSHAVHADNCNLLPNGTCTKQPPAYTWRDYSAIIYLNDDFEGGEFIFAADIKAKNVQDASLKKD
ncbi:prolyl 3-hydroxylase 1 isoform X2 [Anabrus simplex]|uniref:prolyl 3-hydroxylase 1 isoform X2 n=1 Tax=Anabrus simplex TaxID=316456 RepID=UPI0035A3A656